MPKKILEERLQELVVAGDLNGFRILTINDSGKKGRSDCRNREALVIVLPSGKKLMVDTFCSGSAQDTVLM